MRLYQLVGPGRSQTHLTISVIGYLFLGLYFGILLPLPSSQTRWVSLASIQEDKQVEKPSKAVDEIGNKTRGLEGKIAGSRLQRYLPAKGLSS